MIFFKPNDQLIESIIKYANNRTIVDIGCGSKFPLIQQMFELGYRKLVGIDFMLDWNEYQKFRGLNFREILDNSIHLLNYDITNHPQVMNNDKMLYLFCRPCHSNFVEVCLNNMGEGCEALYITVPENLETYDDLGEWKNIAKEIKLNGSSIDNEIILSIKK